MKTLKEQMKCKVIGHVALKKEGKAVIVTKNPAFADYIKKYANTWGYNEVNEDTRVIQTATKRDVAGKLVFGIIPNYLAKHAISVVELEVVLPKSYKGSRNSLSLTDLEKYVSEKNVHEYCVSELV